MTGFELYCDYMKAKAKANELDRTANSIRRLAENDLRCQIDSLSSSWSGEAKEMYCKNGKKYIAEMLETAKSLNKTANTVRQVAERIYRAEMKALEIARKRDY